VTSCRTLTAATLAARIGKPETYVETLLEASVRAGVVVKSDDGYQLSATAERLHGVHLRNVEPDGAS
jgi:hypothetical protein